MEFLLSQNSDSRITRSQVKSISEKRILRSSIKSLKSINSLSTLPSQSYLEDKYNSPMTEKSIISSFDDQSTLMGSQQNLMDIEMIDSTNTRVLGQQQSQQNKCQSSSSQLSFSDLFKNSSKNNSSNSLKKAICNFRELPGPQPATTRSSGLLQQQSKKIYKQKNEIQILQQKQQQQLYLQQQQKLKKPQYKQQPIKKYFPQVPKQRYAEDYCMIKLKDQRKNRCINFICFNDRELFMPQNIRDIKLPQYVSDNDQQSDDQTIKNALQFQIDSIQKAVQSEKKKKLLHFCDLSSEEEQK